MRIGRVIGNVVSTIKDASHHGLKLMVAVYIDSDGKAVSEEFICSDAADSGIGDIVIINDDGGAGQMLLNDNKVIIDQVIAGVVDHISIGGAVKLQL